MKNAVILSQSKEGGLKTVQVMNSNNYTVYIVECFDSVYYIGVTNDLERRLWEHNTGFKKKCFTYTRRPVELKYFETTIDITQAISREKQFLVTVMFDLLLICMSQKLSTM